MDFAKIEQSVVDHVNDLFDWLETPDCRLVNYVDYSMWEEELWSETPSSTEDVLGKVKERFDRVGKFWRVS